MPHILLIESCFKSYVQISSLAMENKVMVVKLQQTKKDPSIVRHDSTTASFERESKEVTELSAAVSEVTVCIFGFFFWGGGGCLTC